ncbi:MAG: ABC transporter permease [Propionibacteriaceae bacterium]|nr:ABC transporter permease [Propionibacteriaceae bacterium]
MAVAQTIVRRVGVFVLSLLGATVVVFLIVQALPGDVAQATLGMAATPEQVEALRERWGLNRPAWARYVSWLGGLFQGDLGQSYLTGQSVSGQIGPRLAVTCQLVGLSMPIAVLASVPTGLVAAMWRRRWQGVVTSALSQIGMAAPIFFVGIVLVVVFAVRLNWLPANGYNPLLGPAGFDLAGWGSHLVLPVASLVIVQASLLSRYVRNGFVEVLAEDYLRTARAVGWTKWRALVRHGLRNAALSIVTVIALQISAMLVGAIIVEQVFALPGLGSLLLQAVASRDLPVVRGIAILLVVVVLAISLVADLVYVLIDPRLRSREAQ